jgi:penicillin-binding protein 1A
MAAFLPRARSWLSRHGILLLATLPLLAGLYVVAQIPFTPPINDVTQAKAQQPGVLLSADGRELASFKRINREWVRLDDISPHVVAALLATEDRRFYEHRGVDVRRTVAAALKTAGGKLQGGSTIT